MNRRHFLMSISAAAVSAAVPLPPLPLAAPVAPAAVAPQLLAFIVGTPGEWDAQVIFAESAKQAFIAYQNEFGFWDDEMGMPDFDPECVTRIAAWDDKDEKDISAADWLRAGIGTHCSRCNYEVDPDMGALIVGDEVVCEYCTTLKDRIAADAPSLIEELADDIACDGPDKVQKYLETFGAWEEAQASIWPAALAEAANA